MSESGDYEGEEDYVNGDDEDYDYVYEEDEDIDISPGKLQREISESHFDVPEGGYRIHEYIEIAPLMEKLILEVKMLLGVDKGTAELLLRHTKWDQSVLAEKFFNNSAPLLIAAGIETGDLQVTDFQDMNQCLICYDEIAPGNGKSLKCGHTFCM